jgi:hypothetical protein
MLKLQYQPIVGFVDTYTPRIMSGVMQKDWQKALSGLKLIASEYIIANHLDMHPDIEKIGLKIPDEFREIVSAALWVVSQEIAENGN